MERDYNFHVFALHHFPQVLGEIPNFPWLTKIHLPSLETTPKNDQCHAESRFWLANALEPSDRFEILGQLNGRCCRKYPGFHWSKLPERIGNLKTNEVGATWIAPENWADYSETVCPGMGQLLREMSLWSDLKLNTQRRTVWANDFIVRRDVWIDFRKFFRRVFDYFAEQYGVDLPFQIPGLDNARKPAYFWERIASLYFANRLDLEIVQI